MKPGIWGAWVLERETAQWTVPPQRLSLRMGSWILEKELNRKVLGPNLINLPSLIGMNPS